MNFRRISCGAIVVAILAALVAATPASATETLKATTCLAKNNDLVKAYLQLFQEPLNKKGAGLIHVDYIGGPEVTPSRKQAAALSRGLVDIIMCPASYYVGTVPEARLLAVTNKSVDEMRSDGAYALLQKAWAERLKAKIIGWCCTDQQFHTYLSEMPKIKKDGSIDYNGMRLRSTELYTPYYEAMNASPVNMPAEDIYTAMERGLVKGFSWPDGGVIELGVKDQTKYMVDVPFYRGTSMIIINLPKFKSLPKKAQDLIVAQGIEYEHTSMPFMKEKAKVDWAALTKAGMKKIELSPQGKKIFLKTAYDAAWKEMEGHKYMVNFKKLKSLTLNQD